MTETAIYKEFVERKIKEVRIEYAGSGDSGGREQAKILFEDGREIEAENNDILVDVLEDLLYNKVGADFNNDGSSGSAKFTRTDESVIKFECAHVEYFIDSRIHDFDEIIIDPSEYL